MRCHVLAPGGAIEYGLRMEALPLFSSPLLDVREVLCGATRGEHGDDEQSLTPCVAIPLRGCYIVERQRDAVVADPNTAIFFEPGVPYRVAHPADDGDVSFVIACELGIIADAFGNGARHDAEQRPFRATHAQLAPRLQLRARQFRRSLASCGFEPLLAEESAFAIVAGLAETRAPENTPAQRIVVERAKAFLGEHVCEPVSLGEVAHAARTSPFSLARAFPAVTGTTLHQYLVSLRLAASLDALGAGATNLSRVAVDAGFAHHSHLTKTFVRVFGATPSAIRKQLRAR